MELPVCVTVKLPLPWKWTWMQHMFKRKTETFLHYHKSHPELEMKPRPGPVSEAESATPAVLYCSFIPNYDPELGLTKPSLVAFLIQRRGRRLPALTHLCSPVSDRRWSTTRAASSRSASRKTATTRTPPSAGSTAAGRCSSPWTDGGNHGGVTRPGGGTRPPTSCPCSRRRRRPRTLPGIRLARRTPPTASLQPWHQSVYYY